MEVEFLTIGRVRRLVGLQGKLEIDSLTDFSDRFRLGQKVYLSPPLPHLQELTIERAQSKGKRVILKLREINSREEIENIVGSFLHIRIKEAQKLPADTYWHHQIIGLEVVDLDGQALGTIGEIIRTGSNDVYVARSGEKEVLIPATKEVIKQINLEKGVMTVRLLPGLVE